MNELLNAIALHEAEYSSNEQELETLKTDLFELRKRTAAHARTCQSCRVSSDEDITAELANAQNHKVTIRSLSPHSSALRNVAVLMAYDVVFRNPKPKQRTQFLES